MKAVLAVAAGLLAGLAAGAIWTWAQADRYRADARVLVRPASARIVPAVEALAESSLVESNVAQTLRLSSPPDIAASTGDGGVLTVSAAAGSRERARQIDAEAVAVLMQKVEQRFATTVGVATTVLDPAHAAEQTSPTPRRNFLIAGLIGLAAGLGVAAAPAGRHSTAAATADPRVERRLRARIDQVAKRERALAQRAGALAAREQDLERRQAELARAADRAAHAEQDLVRQRRDVEERQAELETAPPEPAPEPVPRIAPAGADGGWTLDALDALVDANAGRFPEQEDEWRSYLFFLRDHADVDGRLPPHFEGLVAEVFAPLVR